jgi:hypothetical protein
MDIDTKISKVTEQEYGVDMFGKKPRPRAEQIKCD